MDNFLVDVKINFNKKIDCLDFGYVELIDYMGNDKRIVEAARQSTQKESKSDLDDKNLIRYLMRHKHTSPFEFVVFTFKVKAPIFVARQWFRHRTGSFSEVSGRYTELKTEFYTPESDRIKGKGIFNKQGSEGNIEESGKNTYLHALEALNGGVNYNYQLANKIGIANEIARICLPVSTYTEWYWKVDLHNLLHFLKLRLDGHAQYEIRVFANAIVDHIKNIVPDTWEAFEDYTLYAQTLSKQELNIIKSLLGDSWQDTIDFSKYNLTKTQKQEFLNKLL